MVLKAGTDQYIITTIVTIPVARNVSGWMMQMLESFQINQNILELYGLIPEDTFKKDELRTEREIKIREKSIEKIEYDLAILQDKVVAGVF